MGSWPLWQDLTPLIDVAKGNATPETIEALNKAKALLRQGKVRSADQELASVADGGGRHWISTARADLAAIHFTVCVRGVAWRLPEAGEDGEAPTSRVVERDPSAPVLGTDISVEALLTNIDAAVDAKDPTVSTQARIARARITTFVVGCPATRQVADRASAILRSDLAQLAAEAHLTPDLAFVWAGIQLEEYSGAAARPLLLQAKEGGFNDPSVEYLLAVVALEMRDLPAAETHAKEAMTVFEKLGDKQQQAQCLFVRGEVARLETRNADASAHYGAAVKLVPAHAAAQLGLARVALAQDGVSGAITALQRGVLELLGPDLSSLNASLDAAANIEALVILTDGDLEFSEITRSALLSEIDLDERALARAIRYYYAATLDARLGEWEAARGHAATSALELEEVDFAPINPREFLKRLDEALR